MSTVFNLQNVKIAITWSAHLELQDGYYRFLWEAWEYEGEAVPKTNARVLKRNEIGIFIDVPTQSAEDLKVKAAMSALRIEELKVELEVDSLLIVNRPLIKEKLLRLALKTFKNEYMGDNQSVSLYLQTASKILDISMETLYELALELVSEKLVGLFGNMLIPFSLHVSDEN
jgi:hypothetical protein